MCQFCHQHGEGKKWYLRAENYSEELLADLKRRRYVEEFFRHPEGIASGAERLAALDKTPALVKNIIRPVLSGRQKSSHFGQVLPIEDVAEVLNMTTSVVRLACICRYSKLKTEARYCYGLSMAPGGGRILEILSELDGTFLNGPDTSGFEVLSPKEALAAITRHDDEGLCHTIWTFQTPFIGGICNCDRADCQALNISLNLSTKVMFRAEYSATIDEESCTGCRDCFSVCHFGALEYSRTSAMTKVNTRNCYGCGVCRAACPSGAIKLVSRAAIPAAAGLW
ncbi:ATP-binding protein [Dehalogenimonas alkenigignens]|uniref:ATP-binding protein n=1 Tax=Dehalogenimonas alkenigignens TaxID=1217799 RepID=UPI000D5864C4|nr:4Fe-4S binding protein [Dehalogenimonas alkenigignens]PVV85202.1 4Fe-4S ferredoxin [Dehalogenimonas alkenigignens]